MAIDKLTGKLTWRRYYWRMIGYALAGAGGGLVLDELIHGPFTLTPANHEFWGLVLLIVGAVCISKKPHGKDLPGYNDKGGHDNGMD